MNIVIVNCFDTYEQRADMLYRFFTGAGDKVRIYTSDFLHIKKKKRTEGKKDYNLIPVKPYKKNLSFARLYSHRLFAKSVVRLLDQEKTDILWVLLPPNSLAKEIAEFKKDHPDVKVVFDVIDLWPETMPISNKLKKLPFFALWAQLRDNSINKADYVVTECDLFRRGLCNVVSSDKLETIYLAKNFRCNYEENITQEEGIALCYLGSINNIIDISVICKIISTLSHHTQVKLHIIGEGERLEELLQSTKKAGAEVIYHGAVYDWEKKNRIMSLCHYGLNIMKPFVTVGLSMKSMDYFESGLPIINNIRGDIWTFCEHDGIGINYGEHNWEKKALDLKISRKEVRRFAENNFSEQEFFHKLKKLRAKVMN